MSAARNGESYSDRGTGSGDPLGRRLGQTTVLAAVLALVTVALLLPATAFAADNTMCLSCHDEALGMSVPDVDRDVACKSCHLSFAGTHPFHQIGANCGAACHPGWGDSLLTATPTYTDPISGAAFASAVSKDLPASVLHVIHASPRWPATASAASSACASCHATAACVACHTGVVSDKHATHASSGNAAYDAEAPWSGTMGHGVVMGDQTQVSAAPDTNQCAAAGCHDLAGTQTRKPRLTEDYNYGIGTNPSDPSGTNAALTTSGIWRARASNVYTGARMSYNNVAGSEMAATVSGGRVEIVSDRDPYRGVAQVLVDGAVVGTFDGYAPTTSRQVTLYSVELTAGAHTVAVRPTGTRSSSARGTFVVVDAFRVYPATPGSIAPECATCHPDKADDHDALTVHDVTLASPCGECHEANLATEHALYKAANGTQMGCKTCHGSLRNDVKTAVRTGDKACTACHGADHAVNKDFCYGCHTDSLRTYPGKTVAETHAHQTAIYGNWSTATYIPGSFYGVPECASCHRGHKGFWGSTSAEQNEVCFQCHTGGLENSYWDPWETGGVVPFKWPSKATWERTAHSQDVGETDLIKVDTDFDRGATYAGLEYTSNALSVQETRNMVEGLPAVMSPAASAGGDIGPIITTWANYNRFLYTTYGNWYWVSATIDLGAARAVNGARSQTGAYYPDPSTFAQAVHVYTSNDNVNWTFAGGTGTQGVPNRDIKTTFTPVIARYVRVYTGSYKQANSDFGPGWEINMNRIEVYEPVASGTWTSSVRDIGQEGTATSAKVTWSESRPASAEQTISASVSLDGGATWGAWNKVTNGGTIPGLVGIDITNARLRYRVEMKRTAASEDQFLYYLKTRISRATGNALGSYPDSGAPVGSCANCHEVHGSAGTGAVRKAGNELCFTCHDAPGITREADYMYKGRAAYEASGHGSKSCESCHASHGWADNMNTGYNIPAMLDNSSYYGEYGLCLKCHNSAANSANGISIQSRLASGDKNQKHNLNSSEWSTDSTRLECTDCHVVHTATGQYSLRDPDTLAPAANTVPDPFITGKVIYPDKDAGIFSKYPKSNSGGSTEILVHGQTQEGNTDFRSMLIRFPLESVPETWTISSAKLTLYTKNFIGYYMPWSLNPVTRAWDEGYGTSVFTDYDVDGATWNEWTYGDGAWTGSGPTDWAVPGGDIETATVATTGSGGKYVQFDATAVINRLRQTGNFGMLISSPGDPAGHGNWVYSSESLYPPKLELTFSGVPQRMIPDGAAFCMSCHDGSPPRDVKLGTATWQVNGWATDSHGFGIGAIGNSANMDAYGAINKPFKYGQDPLACSYCHDPHGSSTAFHLTSLDRKTSYNIAADGYGAKQFCAQCHELPWHAGHDQASAGYNPATYDRCFNCHKHGAGMF